MSGEIYCSGKSKIFFHRDKVLKSYLVDISESEHKILGIKSSHFPPVYYFRKESSFLETMDKIHKTLSPDSFKPTPELYHKVCKPVEGSVGRREYAKLEIMLERIYNPNFMDLIIEKLKSWLKVSLCS